jgi:uncharacterized hydrophobic protein (TIGR00271 family)
MSVEPPKGSSISAWSALRNGLSRLGSSPRMWKSWWVGLAQSVNHDEILNKSRAEASFTFNHAFMVAIASGIATIGLLANSPAVIIGAMLLSPLMGPIVSTGFAVASFDVEMGRRAIGTLLSGVVLAIVFAAVISALSPLNELTSEILARTRPNLLDLAVAILSGAAGGYAVIRGRGGAIVGVAIATALMPPLATVGFGLATLQWSIVRGAMLLFITNLAAIALAVAAVAFWYGFGRIEIRKRFAIQALISVLILVPLAVPLSISLRSIAWESRVHAVVRSVLEAGARRLPQGQLAQVQIRFRGDKPPLVEAIVVSQHPEAGFSDRMAIELQQSIGVPMRLVLTQLQADDPEGVKLAVNEAQSTLAAPAVDPDPAAVMRSEFPFPLAALQVDAVRKTVVAVPSPQAAVGLAAWRDIETEFARRHSGWRVAVTPPPIGLPFIEFSIGVASLDKASEERLQVVAWALERWGANEVLLTGHASSTGGGPLSLAEQRVATVAHWLGAHSVKVRGQAFYPAPKQVAREREVGEVVFRSVEIALAPAADPSSRSALP